MSDAFGDYLSNTNPGRQTDGHTDGQTDGNGRPISSYCRGHERSRKRKSSDLVDGLDYNTSYGYAREVIISVRLIVSDFLIWNAVKFWRIGQHVSIV